MKIVICVLGFWAFSFTALAQEGTFKGQSQIQINPQTLREHILSGNTSILISLNHVHQAKDRVNIARGNLLPSINLAAAISLIANPGFAVGAIEFLLPFLLPSRWFDYFQQKDLLEAEKQGYHLLQLNTLASAYSLYHTILTDQKLLEIAKTEYADLKQIYEILAQRDEVLGNVSKSSLLHAKAQMDFAAARVAKLEELVIAERAEFRKALSLPLEMQMEILPTSVSANSWEDKPISEAVRYALEVAPEARQLNYLLKAAQWGQWSKIFAFISGAAVGIQVGLGHQPMTSASFNNLQLNQNINFGFAYFPAIELSQRSIEEIKIRQQELVLENTALLEKTILGLKQAIHRQNMTFEAQKSMQAVYLATFKKFELGMETLLNVLITRKQMTDTLVELATAENNLNLQRILLARTLLVDEFAKVPGCQINEQAIKEASGSAWEWIKSLFTGKTQTVSIDKACSAKRP